MTASRPTIVLLAGESTSAAVLYGLYDVLFSVGAVYLDMTMGAPGSEALKLANSFLPPGYLGDIMRDGFSDSFKLVNGRLPDALRLCLHDNGAARFVDLDATEDFSRPTIDARGYDCKLPPLREVLITPR